MQAVQKAQKVCRGDFKKIPGYGIFCTCSHVAMEIADNDDVALLVAVDDKHDCTSACSRCEDDRRHCGIGGVEGPDLPGNRVGRCITSFLWLVPQLPATFHKIHDNTTGKDKPSNPSKTVRRKKMPLVLEASTVPSYTAACSAMIKSSKRHSKKKKPRRAAAVQIASQSFPGRRDAKLGTNLPMIDRARHTRLPRTRKKTTMRG